MFTLLKFHKGEWIMMTKSLKMFGSVLLAAAFLTGCQANYHKQAVQDDTGDRVTLGKVQKEIRIGMSGADVAQALGSPNIVTTDDQRREVWVYDKISTEYVYSNSSGGVNALLIGLGSDLVGGGGTGVSGSSGAKSTTQRTMTIIIRFDESGKVRDFSYNTSSF